MEAIVLLVFLASPFFLVYYLRKRSKAKKLKALEERKQKLMLKYEDAEIVYQIMNQQFWQGQTPAQLVDSIGHPADIETKVLKTKSREIWKYGETGKGRYSLRVTFENDEVVGWEQK